MTAHDDKHDQTPAETPEAEPMKEEVDTPQKPRRQAPWFDHTIGKNPFRDRRSESFDVIW